MSATLVANRPALQDMLLVYGSFRRLIELYWQGRLTPMEEREIEDHVPKEMIIGYKPI